MLPDPSLSRSYETALGTITLTATKRDQMNADAETLTINRVPYALRSIALYRHDDGVWRYYEQGGSMAFYGLRRTDKSGIDDGPSWSARERLTDELERLAATYPEELLEAAEERDHAGDITERENRITRAEEYISDLRREIALLRAGGREEYRAVRGWSNKHRVIVLPDGATERTHTASFGVD